MISFISLTILFSASPQAAKATALGLSRYHGELVGIMIEWEAKSNSVAWQFPMLTTAEAGDASSCLIAGWAKDKKLLEPQAANVRTQSIQKS